MSEATNKNTTKSQYIKTYHYFDKKIDPLRFLVIATEYTDNPTSTSRRIIDKILKGKDYHVVQILKDMKAGAGCLTDCSYQLDWRTEYTKTRMIREIESIILYLDQWVPDEPVGSFDYTTLDEYCRVLQIAKYVINYSKYIKPEDGFVVVDEDQ